MIFMGSAWAYRLWILATLTSHGTRDRMRAVRWRLVWIRVGRLDGEYERSSAHTTYLLVRLGITGRRAGVVLGLLRRWARIRIGISRCWVRIIVLGRL